MHVNKLNQKDTSLNEKVENFVSQESDESFLNKSLSTGAPGQTIIQSVLNNKYLVDALFIFSVVFLLLLLISIYSCS